MFLKKFIQRLKAFFGGGGGGIGKIPPIGNAPDDQRVSLRALHFPDGGDILEEIETPVGYAYPRSRGSLGESGRPITFETAHRFINEYVRDADGDDVAAITFNKDILLLLLSQSECEGIRFYYGCYPKSRDKTLVLVGVDKNDNDLGVEFGDGDQHKCLFKAQPAQEDAASEKGGSDSASQESQPEMQMFAARSVRGSDKAEPTLLFEVGGHRRVREL